MKRMMLALFCTFTGTTLSALAAGDSVLAPGATVEKLVGGFTFTEGPTCDAAGNVFFTDQPNNRIVQWSVEGRLSTFLEPSGRANGMCFDAQGNLIACADEQNQLWSISPSAQITVLVTNYQGKLLNGPNDVWVHPRGGLYFTDPLYKRSYWNRGSMEQDGQHVYYLAADRQQLLRVADDLEQPNGIIGTPDGRSLFVADIRARKTYRYQIQPDASLTNKTLFCSSGSDGMTLDEAGNLYLTGRGVLVFNAEGKQIQQIDVPEPWTANVCFGGKDKQTLFITASKGLYAVRTRVRGANPAK